jgi:hypothetical protein
VKYRISIWARLLGKEGPGFCNSKREMKALIGRPGSVSGLVLRLGQCVFAAAAIGVMVSAYGFSSFTAFWYFLFSFCL